MSGKSTSGGGGPSEGHGDGTSRRVVETIARVMGVEPGDLEPGSRFVEDLGADSLRIMELVLELQEEFSIDIPDEAIEEIRSVGDAIAYVGRCVEG